MISKEFEDLVGFLSKTPETIRLLIDSVPDAAIRLKSSEFEFSILEHVCHLRDIETEGYNSRVKRILDEHRPSLPDLDGNRLALERDYNSQDLKSALQSFSQARELTVEVLQKAGEEQLEREGNLEGVGTITLLQLLRLQGEHDEGHLQELSALRRQVISRL